MKRYPRTIPGPFALILPGTKLATPLQKQAKSPNPLSQREPLQDAGLLLWMRARKYWAKYKNTKSGEQCFTNLQIIIQMWTTIHLHYRVRYSVHLFWLGYRCARDVQLMFQQPKIIAYYRRGRVVSEISIFENDQLQLMLQANFDLKYTRQRYVTKRQEYWPGL